MRKGLLLDLWFRAFVTTSTTTHNLSNTDLCLNRKVDLCLLTIAGLCLSTTALQSGLSNNTTTISKMSDSTTSEEDKRPCQSSTDQVTTM